MHQAAKLVAALLRAAKVTAGLMVESNGSLPPGLWLTSPAGWLPRTGISSGILSSVIEYGPPLPFTETRRLASVSCSLSCWRNVNWASLLSTIAAITHLYLWSSLQNNFYDSTAFIARYWRTSELHVSVLFLSRTVYGTGMRKHSFSFTFGYGGFPKIPVTQPTQELDTGLIFSLNSHVRGKKTYR